ncbi:fructose-bisphosphate aldolase class II [Mycobacterium frederiksbergense]|uniref:Fructose-bisphosphate aldolase class II n=1 Tax=Mycolicibacterium frederiksbergense TaxID=117567 RepID=A0ABT6KXD7_9MYCO|nr:class II fructose-bisphosphate aldolase [Mycolicibacterium frederiksbergense]MDH6195366.1 fructose-bisphosphate aldolase class II [Mycolicibacterium frederiksbergense]
MPLTDTADLVASAASTGTAVLAFNVITIEHAEGIAEGAERAGLAALLQVSENTIRFHGGRLAPLVSACAQIATHSTTPLAVHLDHLQDAALTAEAIMTAADLGVSSLMVDAAHLPYLENVDRTRSFTAEAHAAGLWMEAELGEIGGKGGATTNAHVSGARTDPQEAAAFVAATGVDGLAVAIGSSHAMTTREAELDFDLITALAADLPIPLVLHGSSGVSDAQLGRAVQAGIRKINIGTALNAGYTSAIRASLAANPAVTDPRGYLAAARQAIGDLVVELGTAIAASPVSVRAERTETP